MDTWTLLHDAIFAVVPSIKVPVPALVIGAVLAAGVVYELRSLRR